MLEFPGMTADDIKVFLIDAEEQLQALEDGLLELEQVGEDEEVIGQIFRAAHTLKGSSATLGHEKMAKLTHSMESLLDLVRKSKLEVGPDLMDVLFECLDVLRVLNREVETGQESGEDITVLTGRLLDIIACAEEETTEADSEESCAGGRDRGEPAPREGDMDGTLMHGPGDVELAVAFTKDCPMPSVRAYQVADRLSVMGNIIYTVPSMERIEAGEDVAELTVAIQWDGDSPQPLVEAAMAVSDVESAVVVQVRPTGSLRAHSEASAAAEVFMDEATEKGVAPAARGDDDGGSEAGAKAASGASAVAARTTASAMPTRATTVRVDVARLDVLSNLVAELVIDRTHLAQLESKLAEKHGGDGLVAELNRTSTHIGRLTTELQEAINKARMFPIANVFRRFPRMVRDLAQGQGKEIDFIIEGEDTELDRSVSEEIGDPLIHLIRNAVGHGIESPEDRVAAGKPRKGTVKLSAFHQENYIVIQIADDGRGIDPDAIRESAVSKGLISEDTAARLSDRDAVNLIFSPGLSTSKQVDDVSGRGVGMDIVRKNIERLNGTISIDTVMGEGSTFTVKLPLTLAIIRALLVGYDSRIYAIPLASVMEITMIELSDIHTVHGSEAIRLRGDVVPLLWLGDVFARDGEDDRTDQWERMFAVITSSHEGQVGLVVDSLVGEMEIVIKSVGSFIGNIPGVSGVTILGDGRVALILDVPSLVRRVVEERNDTRRS
ncbi:MAG: chemotaxis protein CheA [Firmicutes bacterium]|nr:chemotaxis protein CheA [Bacillota bacterium]MDD4336414.1 chemotaxis protein CheA [Bacillota bacterium]